MTQQLDLSPSHLYDLNPVLSQIALGPVVSLDVETSGRYAWKDRLRLIAIKSLGKTYLIQPEYYNKQELTEFFKRLAECEVVGHSIKFDAGFIYCNYGVLLPRMWCTQLGSQVLYGGNRLYKHNLDLVLKRELKIEIGSRESKKENQKSFLSTAPLTPEQLNYAAGDVEHLEKLRSVLQLKLDGLGLDKVMLLENRLIPVLVKMESEGCLIDVEGWMKQIKEWEKKRKSIIADLDAEAARLWPYMLFTNINYSSSKQIIQFFKNLGLEPPIKEERKGRGETIEKESVDEDTLDNYINEHSDSPIINFLTLLKDFREFDKLVSTYGDSFLERIDSRGYIHTRYGQCSTATHRLSSSDPNLQNLPSNKSGAGGIVRHYFIAPPGFKMITCDMEGAEITIAADQSKDPLLLKNVLEGADIHSQLASISFSIIYDAAITITKTKEPIEVKGHSIIPVDAREVHKSATFSKFYKGGPPRIYGVLARYINAVRPPKERMPVAKQISEAIDRALPVLSAYLTSLIDKANAQGYLITTKLGRRRYFGTKVYGEAANAPIQGSNADAIKIAMVNLYKYLCSKPQLIGASIVLNVHDELVVIAPEAHAKEVAEATERIMSDALTAVLRELKGKAKAKINDYWDKD